jgi:phosphoribosylamine--glycine ligase
MRILVIGSGAREHALVWKLTGERYVREVYCAPGNAGTGRIAHNVAIPADDVDWLAEWAAENKIDLTVVGPEAPLALGVVDRFRERELRIVGPTAAAARLESSKVFAKEFMARHGIPTARFEVVPKDAAITYVRSRPADDYPLVLKADGLAGGKGTVVAAMPVEAEQALETLGRLPGGAGQRVVIEEFLRGTELSVLALTDGTTILPLPAARDYKRLGAGNSGPMTGGMGAYSPPAIATDALLDQVRTEILEPTVRGLAAEGTPYSGVLYAGLMITERGPHVLEFNARFGDPETQCILPRLRSELMPLLFALTDSTLHEEKPAWRSQACCAVVVASGGYPGEFETGYGILGLDELEKGVMVFHGATRDPYVKETGLVMGPTGQKKRERLGNPFSTMFGFGRKRAERVDRQARQALGDPFSKTITAGGRVLTVAALGNTVEQARALAYRNAERIVFTGRYFRPDIAADD